MSHKMAALPPIRSPRTSLIKVECGGLRLMNMPPEDHCTYASKHCEAALPGGRRHAETAGANKRISGAVSTRVILDWYDLGQELILVLERPVSLHQMQRRLLTRIILKQLVDAAVDLQEKHIFHRDIKRENILIETGSDVPHVHVIDFGLSRFVKKGALLAPPILGYLCPRSSRGVQLSSVPHGVVDGSGPV